MTYSIALIDKAGEKCGSFYALSKRIDLAQSTITEIRKGKRPLPVDVVPELAQLTGVDVDDAIHQVLMERAAGTRREGVLREILGKVLAIGVVAMSLFFYNDNAISGQASTLKSETGLTKIILYCSGIAFLLGDEEHPRSFDRPRPTDRMRRRRLHRESPPPCARPRPRFLTIPSP